MGDGMMMMMIFLMTAIQRLIERFARKQALLANISPQQQSTTTTSNANAAIGGVNATSNSFAKLAQTVNEEFYFIVCHSQRL
jgi:hypothetical protein